MKIVMDFLKQQKYLILFLILGFICFGNILNNKFVWLDSPYILNNPESQTLNLYNLFDGFSLTGFGNYRPLSAVILTFIYLTFKFNPFFYHFLQILIYSLNAYLVFLLFKRFFKEKLSLFLAIVFYTHTLNEGVVAFISSFADVLYVFFGLLALLISTKRIRLLWKIIAVNLLLFASILSKESGFIFFLAVIFMQFFILKKKTLVYIVSGIITFLGYMAVRSVFHGFYLGKIEAHPFANSTFLEKIITVPKILSFYIGKFFVPFNIGGIHIWTIDKITFSNFYFPLFLDVLFFSCLLLIGYYVLKREKKDFYKFIFFFLLFIVGLSPYLQIIPLDYTVAGRWFYVSIIGLLGIAGLMLETIHIKKIEIRKIITVIAIIVIVLLTLRTLNRNRYWKDDVTLFNSFSKAEDNYVVENLLAGAYISEHNYQEALIHENQSVEMFPYDNNLVWDAYIYEQLGNMQKAQELYIKSISANNYAPGEHGDTTYRMLARFFILTKDNKTALTLLEHALRDYPNEPYFWELIAVVRHNLHDQAGAASSIQRALSLSPNDPDIRAINDAIQNNIPFSIKTN